MENNVTMANTEEAKEHARGECTKTLGECTKSILPVRDALEVLSGKWKLPIIISLMFGNKRFSQIAKEVPGITDKMLSKELRDLEANELVKRSVYNSIPVIVEYSLTEYGFSLQNVIIVLRDWGAAHRKRIMGTE
jgi:DNA-binding HxlR family transcriptional regulator